MQRHQQYRLTDEELDEIMEASKPVLYMVVGGVGPRSPQEKVMDVWRKIAVRVNCDVESIGPADSGDYHDFKAEPLTTEDASSSPERESTPQPEKE